MDLYKSILLIHPDINPKLFNLRNNADGEGRFIEWWDAPEEQPSEGQLDTAWDSYVAEGGPLKEEKIKATEQFEVAADVTRSQFQSLNAGAISDYNEKQFEFRLWKSEGEPTNPNPNDYPYAFQEAKEFSTPPLKLDEMLAVYRDTQKSRAVPLAKVTNVRRKFKREVDRAEDSAGVQAALQTGRDGLDAI